MEYVKDTFSSKQGFDKIPDIWITEFNLGLLNNTISNGLIHGMFVMSWVSSSVCNHDIMKMLLLHAHSGQYGYTSPGYDDAVFLPGLANKTDIVAFNIVGQLYAHLNYIGMVENRDRMYCLKLEEEEGDSNNNNNNECPRTFVDVSKFAVKNVSCVFGIGFTKDDNDNSFGFMVINACKNTVDTIVHVPGDDSVKKNITKWVYSIDQEMNINVQSSVHVQEGYALFSDCIKDGKMEYVWECGPIQPTTHSFAIEKELYVEMPPFSIVLAATID